MASSASRVSGVKRKRNGLEGILHQLEDIACTVSGWCLVHGFHQRTKHLRVNVRGDDISSEVWNKALKSRKSTTSIQTTHIELERTLPSSSKFLVIGLAPLPEDMKKHNINTATVTKKAKPVGLELPSNKDHIVTPYITDRLMLVVTPVRPNISAVEFGALLGLGLGLGLRKPFKIPQKDVFYFDEFREASKYRSGRSSEWNALVLSRVQRAVDERSTTREKECSTVEDPNRPTAVMQKFMDVEGSFNQQDADTMARDFLQRWPEVKLATAQLFLRLRPSLSRINKAREESFEFRLLRVFVAEGAYQLHKEDNSGSGYDEYDVILEAYKTAKRAIPPTN